MTETNSNDVSISSLASKLQLVLDGLPLADIGAADQCMVAAQDKLRAIDAEGYLLPLRDNIYGASDASVEAKGGVASAASHIITYMGSMGAALRPPVPAVAPMKQFEINGKPYHYRLPHRIGHLAVGGRHPSWEVERTAREVAEQEFRNIQAMQAFINAHPRLTEQYGDVLRTVHDAIVRQYGAERAGQMAVLSSEEYAELLRRGDVPLPPNSYGFATAGFTVLRASATMLERYGSWHLLRNGLHEGSHNAAWGGLVVASHIEPAVVQGGKQTYEGANANYALVEEMGMVRYDDATGQHTGQVWEEVRVESFARHHAPAEKPVELPGIGQSGGIGFVPQDTRQPHVNPETGEVFVPWRYALGAGKGPNGFYLDFAQPAVGVYALDLLDQAKPGLRQDLLDSATDPAAKQRFKDGVNSIRPGLYDEIAQGDYTNEGFANAVRLSVDALGLKDAPPR